MTVAALASAGPGGFAGALGSAGASTRPAGSVVRGFVAPTVRYGSGHLGIDLATAPGAAVRALRPGTVVFAGRIGAAAHVTVRLADGRRVTYAFLRSVAVAGGHRVARGMILGVAGALGRNHDGTVWHLGLRVGDRYVDPSGLLRSGGSGVHLAPLGRGEAGFPAG